MPLQEIYSFLTYPKRSNPEDPLAPGAQIDFDNESKLFRMLDGIFCKAEQDCVVPVMFTTDGVQPRNPVRSELLALVQQPSIDTAEPIALRLQRSTAGTSGMGLMFVCLGEDSGHTRVVLSRFPADEGVVAERSDVELNVQFVEQVFLKSAHSYKAATYVSNGRADQLWRGHVVDRQINHGSKAVADYWIVDFLMSEFATTAAAGTKRLAIALRDAAASTASVRVKQEIASAANLAGNVPSRAMTIADFCDSFNFSEETKQTVLSRARPPRLVHEQFRFDAEEFGRHLAYKQVELNNGAILTAPADRFEQVFQKRTRRNQHTFSTTGEIVDQRLRKSK
ncbi:hypothetical protein ACI2TT_24930 [Ralstonia nicotianae]